MDAKSLYEEPESKSFRGLRLKERQNGQHPRGRKNRDRFPVAPKQDA
jgi:hypothetical protein